VCAKRPLATPKLNIVTINEASCFLDCLGIVGANHRLVTDEMTIHASHSSPSVFPGWNTKSTVESVHF
jgi:hypothetical protein